MEMFSQNNETEKKNAEKSLHSVARILYSCVMFPPFSFFDPLLCDIASLSFCMCIYTGNMM